MMSDARHIIRYNFRVTRVGGRDVADFFFRSIIQLRIHAWHHLRETIFEAEEGIWFLVEFQMQFSIKASEQKLSLNNILANVQ